MKKIRLTVCIGMACWWLAAGIRLKDILIGAVWLCSGQSNMELTAGRVTDKFAEEIARDENPMIRYAKIPLDTDFYKSS